AGAHRAAAHGLPGVDERTVVVRVRRGGPQHPRRAPAVPGRAVEGPRVARGGRRVARAHRLAARDRRRDDPRGARGHPRRVRRGRSLIRRWWCRVCCAAPPRRRTLEDPMHRIAPELGPFRTATTPALEIAYAESGAPDGVPVVLLHGFPYDVHSY